MKQAASSPALTTSSSATVGGVSRTTGPVTGTMTVETSAMRVRPAEGALRVRMDTPCLSCWPLVEQSHLGYSHYKVFGISSLTYKHLWLHLCKSTLHISPAMF